MKQTYLARKGKIYGPFTEREIEILQESKRIEGFRWIWREGDKEWRSIDVAPLNLPNELIREAGSRKRAKGKPIEAICSVFNHIVTGTLSEVTETGCVIRERHASHTVPPVSSQTPAIINLYDPQTQKSVKVTARVYKVHQQESGGWAYHLRWNGAPDLF